MHSLAFRFFLLFERFAYPHPNVVKFSPVDLFLESACGPQGRRL